MQQITEIITNGAISILVVLAGVVVRAVKDYLVQKGGEKTIKIVEILAKNAVNAVEQVAAEATREMKNWHRLALKFVLSLQNTILA
ncbi:phage holin, LL-H family [Streptococcus pneumoniae]|nr:phage holin, LL-H family [Streptococcus pneumoniae]